VLGFGAMQFAARSVAEALGIRYVYAHYSPTALPSPYHAPVALPGWPQDETDDNRQRWAADAQHWNDTCGASINAHRAEAGLPPVDDVRGHMVTEQPWLAADPLLAPWPEPDDPHVVQTGAWVEQDERPLSAELEAFLTAGEPPVYFGLGSTRLPGEDFGRVVVTAARALGRRAIVSRGWSDLSLADDGPDCIVIGEANLQALFRRVAAVVHHGGSGTTTVTARAGAPQVVIPQRYDQFYWAQRVDHLGIGVAHRSGMPTVDSLATALTHALAPEVAARAHTVAGKVRDDGAQAAAQRLTAPLQGPS
jgi:vancomycin aglycone glucosyltransferase